MEKQTYGSRVWFFPDGDIPPKGDVGGEELQGHEALIMLNPNGEDATIQLTVYYENREPAELKPLVVKSRRVRCIRTSEPMDGYQIPLGQYALKVQSTVPIICQFGRADIRQSNLAYYSGAGYAG